MKNKAEISGRHAVKYTSSGNFRVIRLCSAIYCHDYSWWIVRNLFCRVYISFGISSLGLRQTPISCIIKIITVPLGTNDVTETIAQSCEKYCITWHCWSTEWRLNTWRPRQDGRRFVDNIFKLIFLIENCWILVHWSLFPCVPLAINQHWFIKGLGIEQMTSLRQRWSSVLTYVRVTRPGWVNNNSVGFSVKDCWCCPFQFSTSINTTFVHDMKGGVCAISDQITH